MKINTLLYEDSLNALNVPEAKRLAFLELYKKGPTSSSLSAPGGLGVLSGGGRGGRRVPGY
jgi:hypothetical protein